MISTSEVRITCIIAEDELETAAPRAPRGVRAGAAGVAAVEPRRRSTGRPDRGGRGERHRTTGRGRARSRPPERFAGVGSTNDVVRDWLGGGAPEVCLAVADEQTAGRGRNGRTWLAPAGAGAAPARSASGRPGWRRIAPGGWRRSSSLAMADAAEEAAGLPDRVDPAEVAERPRRRAIAGSAAGPQARRRARRDRRASARPIRGRSSASASTRTGAAADFPADLAATMTSPPRAAGDEPIDRAASSTASSIGSRPRIDALRDGRFDAADWAARQVTTGRHGRASSTPTARPRPSGRSASTRARARLASWPTPTARRRAASSSSARSATFACGRV